MPTNNNNQNANQNQSTAAKGDILTQIVAKDATVKDLYLIEKAMSASISSIEKIQQKVNSTLSTIDANIARGSKTLLSIDTTLNRVLSKIDAIIQNNSNGAITPQSDTTDLKNIESVLQSIELTTLDMESALSNIDQNTFDILTTLSNYLSSTNSRMGGSPNSTSTDAVDLSNIEFILNSIDQTTFDILTAIGNLNINSGSQSGGQSSNSTSSASFGRDQTMDAVMRNQYLQTAMYALENNLNIRDELAALLHAQQPSLGQQDFDEQLTEILRSITTPLSVAVETEKDLKDLIDRLNQRVAEGWMTQEEANRLQLEATNNYMTAVLQQAESSKSFADQILDKFTAALPDMLKNAGGKQAIASDILNVGGNVIGDIASTAIKAALPGIAGMFLGEYAEKIIGGLTKNFSEYIGYLTTNAQNLRNEIIKSGFEKIRKDVNDMATYSIDIYTKSVNDIYSAWDANLGKVTATQGYTKEALNTLQDAVAQRLQAEGYGNVINAGDYITELANTLNSKLGGELAEAFAAQNLILQKAVPEVDLSSMGETFAAIYRSAELQGVDAEELMISAMNQVAGATKALEKSTSGNNQFISQIDNLLKKANEVVLSSNGTADQVAEMATQLMAAEAPLSAIAPQLSGFTTTLVDKLLSGNDATAVALRAIMSTLDSNIGISETDFRKSLMEDTQGVLSTAFEAIGQFINDNSNEAAQYEFYKSMETVFGISSNQLAQIDFSAIAQQIADASTATNMKALTDAENLVRAGETTTLEEQLVANTSNQLLATNAIADTLDNALMRKLEQNELALERQIYVLQAEQVVNLAEKTMGWFTGFIDIIQHALDPFGIFDGLAELVGDGFSAVMDAQKYLTTTTASSIGSAVADRSAADAQTLANTVGTALDIGMTTTLALGRVASNELEAIVANKGVVDSYSEMMNSQKEATAIATQANKDAQAAIVDSVRSTTTSQNTLAESLAKTEEQVRESQTYQEKIATATQANKTYEQKRAEAVQQQRALQEAERTMTTANHDNIEAIRESVSKLDELSNYLSPILDENRNQSGLLQTLSEKMDQLMQTIANNAVKTTITSPTPAKTTTYNERDRIYGPIKTW